MGISKRALLLYPPSNVLEFKNRDGEVVLTPCPDAINSTQQKHLKMGPEKAQPPNLVTHNNEWKEMTPKGCF